MILNRSINRVSVVAIILLFLSLFICFAPHHEYGLIAQASKIPHHRMTHCRSKRQALTTKNPLTRKVELGDHTLVQMQSSAVKTKTEMQLRTIRVHNLRDLKSYGGEVQNLSSLPAQFDSSASAKIEVSRLKSQETMESCGKGHVYMPRRLRLRGGAEEEKNTSSPATIEDKPSSKPGAFLGNLDNSRKRSLKLPKTIIQRNDPIFQRMKSAAEAIQHSGSRAIPSVAATLSLLYTSKDGGISPATVYGLALLGASLGFRLFLHFITLGYALGIGLPLSVALCVYNKHSKLPMLSFLHSLMTVMWSVRLLAFFAYREYVSWPALHEKVVEIQERMDIPFASRLLCWLVYSLFYVSMMSMPLGRLQQGQASKWGIAGLSGLLLQIAGLSLEAIADFQKNSFKAQNRHAWCNVGVWKWSTHANYLGEGAFWIGTYLGHGFYSVNRTLIATVGLTFILQVLRGSTKSLKRKHVEKYGDQPDFFEFHRTHGIWGPKKWYRWSFQGMRNPILEPAVAASLADGNMTASINTTAETFNPNKDTPSPVLS